LRKELAKVRDQLCADCQRRSETNPLRVLDCKVPEDQRIIERLPTIADSLCEACKAHFAALQGYLRDREISFQLAPRMVRGLDYYTRTTFEFVHDPIKSFNSQSLERVVGALSNPRFPRRRRTVEGIAKEANMREVDVQTTIASYPGFDHVPGRQSGRQYVTLRQGLGSQNALLGGGRYDGLSEDLGGPPAPGIGFSIGEDRLVLALEQETDAAAERPVTGLQLYIAWMGDKAYQHAAQLARILRALGIAVEVAADAAKLKRSLEIAAKLPARYALIIGDRELAEGRYALREMALGTQRTVSREELVDLLTQHATGAAATEKV
jgi:histidyl-tRNA synthetase